MKHATLPYFPFFHIHIFKKLSKGSLFERIYLKMGKKTKDKCICCMLLA